MGHRHTVTEEIKMSSYLDALPITNLKLEVALRDHGLDRELDERGIRLRLLAIEMELERRSDVMQRELTHDGMCTRDECQHSPCSSRHR